MMSEQESDKVAKKAFRVVASSHSTRVQAEADLLQCKNPKFFDYRTSLFPPRRTYAAELEMENCEVVELETARHPVYEVVVTVCVSGTPGGVTAWADAFRRKAHGSWAKYTEIERIA